MQKNTELNIRQSLRESRDSLIKYSQVSLLREARDSVKSKHSTVNKNRKVSISTRFLSLRRNISQLDKRMTYELDLDMPSNFPWKNRVSSFSNSERSSIEPRPSIYEGGKIAKRVAFVLDQPKQARSEMVESTSYEFPEHAGIDEKTIRAGLIEKDGVAMYPSLYDIDVEQCHTDKESMYLMSHGTEESSISDFKFQEDSVYFKGGLLRAGLPEADAWHPQKCRAYDKNPSTLAFLGKEASYLIQELWPWPWLCPETRAHALYRAPRGRRVTFAQQDYLPRAPVPELEHTLAMYLVSVKSCVRDEQFKLIEDMVKEFANGTGKLCQKKLKHINESLIMPMSDSPRKSWIRTCIPNYDFRYTRLSPAISNTAIIAPFVNDLWPPKVDTQLQRAAVLIELVGEFWQLVRSERLSPVSDEEGHNVCMHAFRKLFSMTKIPGIPCDANISYFATEPESTDVPIHIIVVYKSQIFRLDIVNSTYMLLGQDAVKQRLQVIIDSVDSGTVMSEHGVCVFTSMDRDAWSEVRVRLMELNENNRACLHEIEQAIFVISLDHTTVSNFDWLPHEALFADGCNRWYDRGLNFYVHSNGLVSVNVNTGFLNETVVGFLLHYIHLRIMEDAEKWDDDVMLALSRRSSMSMSMVPSGIGDLLLNIRSRLSLMSQCVLSGNTFDRPDIEEAPRALAFDLDAQLLEVLENANVAFAEMAASVRTATCKYEQYECNLFENKKINTDAFAHLVMHLTFFKMYFRPASIASKVSLMRFMHERHDLMRTTTPQAVEWCKVMLDPQASLEVQKDKFRRAEKKHRELLRETCSGNGCENHLTALRFLADEEFNHLPRLFQEKALTLSAGGQRFDIYSTSVGVGCPSAAVVLPSSPVGYGVGYFVVKTKVLFTVCAYTNEVSTSAELFASGLGNTMKSLDHFMKCL